jgi:antirestriction protein ArdC
MPKATAIFEDMTAEFIRRIEAGKAGNWEKPWLPIGTGFPVNATTGKPYSGANVIWLWFTADRKGYEGQTWATYKQWESLGAQVRKGEKGTGLVKWIVRQCKHAPDERCDKCGKMFPVGFTVFHADQVDGYTPPEVPALTPTERVAAADAWFAALGSEVREVEGDRACYSPTTDTITMPTADQFHTTDGYYATLAHEHGHWTGHESRLARDLSGRFGDESYAMEELVAELTSAFTCAHLGIASVPRKDHAAYLANWARVCRADDRALWAAASKAQQALGFMVERAGDSEAVAAA